MASEMAPGLESVMASDMVTEMVSVLEMEMALGIASESTLIDWAPLFRGDPGYLMGSSSLLFTVVFETDMIAVLEEC